jgi:cell division protein FtsB
MAMASRSASPNDRLRPAPRSRSRGGSGSRVRWDKLGRVVLVIALFAILASYFHPLLGFFGAYQDKKAAATELTELRREHSQLVNKASTLHSRDAAELAARRLGMVRNGERAYVIKGLPK